MEPVKAKDQFEQAGQIKLVFGFDAQAEQFQALCARYLSGEPLQYLLGEWEFFGLPFAVGSNAQEPGSCAFCRIV